MAEAKRVTLINQRDGKQVIPPDPDELKKDPKAKPRLVLQGEAVEVSAEEAAAMLRKHGKSWMDASKLVANVETAEVKKLKVALAAALDENAKLRAKAPATANDADLEDGDAVLLPDGKSTGVIVKMKKKGKCDVKLDENGNVSEFAVADLKPVPAP